MDSTYFTEQTGRGGGVGGGVRSSDILVTTQTTYFRLKMIWNRDQGVVDIF